LPTCCLGGCQHLSHTLDDKIDETYSHVAPSIEARLIAGCSDL
jgi:hypothetical protein